MDDTRAEKGPSGPFREVLSQGRLNANPRSVSSVSVSAANATVECKAGDEAYPVAARKAAALPPMLGPRRFRFNRSDRQANRHAVEVNRMGREPVRDSVRAVVLPVSGDAHLRVTHDHAVEGKSEHLRSPFSNATHVLVAAP